ncbi:MAG TPA: hypothetical protein VNM69_18205 [Bacillus sp. (in: firmicutes)]|nr:hypothetical protein [Bacillus sp. (in: firmicutes)]
MKENQEISIKNAHDKLNKDLSVSYLAIAYLGYLSVTVDSIKPFRTDSGWNKNSNFICSNILTQVTNFSLSIVKLVEQGLDLQAKVLLRSLFEQVNLIIIITSRKEMMNNYCEGVDDNSAFSIWSAKFRTNQIKSMISEIEYDLGLEQDRELFEWLKEDRNKAYKFLSSVAHGAFYTNLLGSYSMFQDEEYMPFALFGSYTDASIYTLEQLNWLIYYLTIMLNAIQIKVHSFSGPDQCNETYDICKSLEQIFLNTYLRNLNVKERV